MDPIKFLLADDSDAKAMMLEAMIKESELDVEILRARTTEEANNLILRHCSGQVGENPNIAFAFVDYEIPSELGPAVIAHLKEINPKARIALVSSGNSEKYQADAKEAGAEAYICTSFEADIVEKNLSELLESWKQV